MDFLPVVRGALESVAMENGVSLDWIMADSRSKNRVRCRHEAIYRLHAGGMSIDEIAEQFDMHPGSVTYAIRKHGMERKV